MSKSKQQHADSKRRAEPASAETPADTSVETPAETAALDDTDIAALAENEAEGGLAGAPAGEGGSEVDRLRAEVADLKDQLLRAVAETENVRSRTRRERDEALKHAAAPLAKDLLSVADNLRRALDSVPGELAQSDERVKSLVDGIEMTERTLLEAFAKHGIYQIKPGVGEKLDPHRHEAMLEVIDPSKPQGTVAQVYEIGYRLHDRLLRPARVGVAKGGAAAGEGGEAAKPGSTVDTQA